MKHDVATITDPAEIRARIAKARLQAKAAATGQHRQHYDGMANYWEEVLDEIEAGGREQTDQPPSGF